MRSWVERVLVEEDAGRSLRAAPVRRLPWDQQWNTVMRRIRWFVAALAAGATALLLVSPHGAGPAAAEPAASDAPRELAERMNRLGVEMIGRLAGARGDSTVIVSPLG